MKILIALILALCCAAPLAAAEGSAPARTVETLWYTHGGSYMPTSYDVFTVDGMTCLCINRAPAQIIDPEVPARLAEIAERYDLAAWDGFDESDPWVLDGSMFSFEMTFSDGTVIHAYGDNMFPEHYGDATDEIVELLESVYDFTPRDLSGTYRYEGEGFGGDFTITLNRDGTYTYSTGPLSSYLGRGEWNVLSRQLTLSEDEESGDYRYNVFIPVGDTLYYAEDDSYLNFPGVTVPDGGKFVKIDPAEGSVETDRQS